MKKLVKKHSLGGFAEAVDKSLDGLGSWGKLGVLMVDPTGISNWADVGKELKTFLKTGSLGDAASLSLTALGAVPMFGVFKSIGKGLKGLGKASKAKKLISKELKNVVKECIDSKTISQNNAEKIINLTKDSPEQANKIISYIELAISDGTKVS